MNGDCGHTEAHYCVMECGDYVTDMHRSDENGPSGCYANYFACWACVQSGDAGTLSDQWWAKHREVCPVGYAAPEEGEMSLLKTTALERRVRFLEANRDKWKARALEAEERLRSEAVAVDHWRDCPRCGVAYEEGGDWEVCPHEPTEEP